MAPKDLDCTLTFKLTDESVKKLNELSKEQLEEAKRLIDKALEDYKEPVEAYYIDHQGDILCASVEDNDWTQEKEIGNYFKTYEDAKKVIEKLKAWKRLKDKGFKFEGWKRDKWYCGDLTIEATDQITCADKDLDLLFGGEE